MGAPRKLRNPKANQLRIAQLDHTLENFRDLRTKAIPPKGWITEIRQALGMTDAQLAKKLGVVGSTATAYQNNERSGSLTLRSLQKVANSLNCDLAYVLSPRTSLRETLDKRLREKALERVRSVGVTMALENQNVSEVTEERQVNALVQDWRLNPPPDLWD